MTRLPVVGHLKGYPGRAGRTGRAVLQFVDPAVVVVAEVEPRPTRQSRRRREAPEIDRNFENSSSFVN